MEPHPKMTPKDFFLYIGAMVTLYWSAGALVALLFTIINTVFKDQLNYYSDPYSSGIRFAIASLIVVFPISVFLFRLIKKDAAQDPSKLLFPIRRWLFALTIFVTALALIIDVIALLNGFLGGELTVRFVLKALSVFLVAGLVFWYCLLEIRVKPGTPIVARKEFLWGAPLLVLIAIVYGFIVMGSPSAVRSLRFDERRTQDLQTIQWQIVNFWQQKEKLPQTLAELEDPISGFKAPTDPRTGESYEYYLPGAATAFQLCAVFEKPTVNPSSKSGMIATPYPPERYENWEHKAGQTCFDRTIDTELYPPLKPRPTVR